MTRVTLGFAEQSEELGLGQLGLPEHLVEQPSRDVAGLLMAHPDQENLTGRQGLLSGLVFLAADELKADASQDHPEFAVGGRRHLGFEKSARSCGSGIEAKSPDIRGMDRAIRALAELIELRHVLLSIIEGHVDQSFKRGFGSIGFGREIEFWTQRDEDLVARLDDHRQPAVDRLQYNGHERPPLSDFDPTMYDGSTAGVSQTYLEDDRMCWSSGAGLWALAGPEEEISHEAMLAHLDHVFHRALDYGRGGSVRARAGFEVASRDVEGRYTGASVPLDGLYQGGPSSVNGTTCVLGLGRSGEVLEGTRYSAWNNSTIPIAFKKVK